MKKTLASSLILVSFFLFISSSYAEIKIFFSPEGGTAEEIIKQIDNAQEYVDIAIYSFTYEPIAKAIIRAEKRGVKIRILI